MSIVAGMYFCAMSKQQNKTITGVSIVDIGAKGKAIGKKDGNIYFVNGAVPGDICDISLKRRKKGFYEADVQKITTYSNERTQPECEHFGVCGGCKWQHLSYSAQLSYKANLVANNLAKIGGVIPEVVEPILGSAEIYFYRNKLEFACTNSRWLTKEEISSAESIPNRDGIGFHIPGLWDKVLNVKKCHLQGGISNDIRNWLRNYAIDNQIDFFDLREKKGLLRSLLVRTTTTGQVMVLVQFGADDQVIINQILSALDLAFPSISALLYVINPKQNDTIYDLDVHTFSGTDYIAEEMPSIYANQAPLKFRIGAKSFYQTNPKQAFHLYKIALEYAQLKGGETVYDLYTGTGTIALFMAQKAAKVIGIESVKEAIDDALINAAENKINNVTFVVGDMRDAFDTTFIATHGKPDVIITDPPRDGMHPKVIEQLLELQAPRIVYVSCNPATQARDLALLAQAYHVVKSRAVDMFPHTHHIENVVLLSLK